MPTFQASATPAMKPSLMITSSVFTGANPATSAAPTTMPRKSEE